MPEREKLHAQSVAAMEAFCAEAELWNVQSPHYARFAAILARVGRARPERPIYGIVA